MASTYLSRTLGTPTNAYKGTLSWWQKGMNTSSTNYIFIAESGNERFLWYGTSGRFQGGLRGTSSPPDIDFSLSGTPYFRDISGWYHCVLAWDSTQGTASDRIKYYVNGVQYTVSGSGTSGVNDIPQNHVMPMNKNGLPFRIGSTMGGGSYFDGIMSHIHFCDGTQYQASDFGSTDATTGEWKINTSPNVNYGNNGFWWLKDTNAATDSSPNSNTPSISGTLTKTEDNPSNVFATGNAIIGVHSNQNTLVPNYSNGNTTSSYGSGEWRLHLSTLGASSGKFYCEYKWVSNSNTAYAYVGIYDVDAYAAKNSGYPYMADMVNCYGLKDGNGQVWTAASGTSYGTSYTVGDIIGVAMDLDNNKCYWSKNGSWMNSANPSSGTGGYSITADKTYIFGIQQYSQGTSTWSANYGNGYFGTTAVSSAGTNASGIGIFEYDVPTGYTALSTKGLNE